MGVVTVRPRCKVYIFERRLHHGLTGCILIAVGTLLCLHDRRDWPWRLRDQW